MKLSIDNLMFDELKKGFDDHLITLVKILTRGPVRTGEVNLKLAVEIDVSSEFKDGAMVDVIMPSFKWTVTSKTAAQKFEHKGSPQGDYQLEIDINGINVEKREEDQEDEQMDLFSQELNENTIIDADCRVPTNEAQPEGHNEMLALPLDESKKPEPWDDNEEVFICHECGFETSENMTKCPKCEGEMMSTELPLDPLSSNDANSEGQSNIAS